MAKTKWTKASARKGQDKLAVAVALERARLKRYVLAKREIARLAGELRRATDRSDRALRDLARDIAERQGEAGIDAALDRVGAAENAAGR